MRLRREASARWQRVPEGMRDLLPEEAERRAGLLTGLRAVFRAWGYREVATPTLEFLETLVQGGGPGMADRLFKIVDRGGELLALRPEMTVPIARLAATRLLQDAGTPLRLAYLAPVFRGQEAGRGRLREFTQAGVELLGEAGPDADAEIIVLAVECLRRAGVPEALLHVSDLGLLEDALVGVPEDARDEVRTRLYRKEFAGIEDAADDPALARFLRALPDLSGPQAVARAEPFIRSDAGAAALRRLSDILERLEDFGVAGQVSVDLSIIRDFSYYTGVVFEAYGPGMGYPLLGGGRYDGLLARFGAECPATGFALGIERVLSAAQPPASAAVDVLVVARPALRARAYALAQRLRALGKSVIVTVPDAARPPVQTVVTLDDDGPALEVIDAGTGRGRRVDVEELLAEVSGRPPVVSWTH